MSKRLAEILVSMFTIAAVVGVAMAVALAGSHSAPQQPTDTRSYERVGRCMDSLYASGERRQSQIQEQCEQFWPGTDEWIMDLTPIGTDWN